jgi:hypothetical protein
MMVVVGWGGGDMGDDELPPSRSIQWSMCSIQKLVLAAQQVPKI